MPQSTLLAMVVGALLAVGAEWGIVGVLGVLAALGGVGWRVLRSLLWRRSGEIASATDKAASWGRGFGYLLALEETGSAQS